MTAAIRRAAILALAVFAGACVNAPRRESWNEIVREKLDIYGHRNIIAVVDAAYPEQSRASIETVATGAHQLDVVRAVLENLRSQAHVRARVMLDRELDYVPEADAEGIGEYRDALYTLLSGQQVEFVEHEKLIAKLDECAQVFDVLVLKTDLALPYTSVFIELECGYWSDAAEQRMRASMDDVR